MNVKKFIFLLLISMVSLAAGAQNRPGGEHFREKLRAQKVAYLSAKVQLTEDEAVKFWPLFFQYEKELYSKRLEILDDVRLNNISDQEADKTLDNFIAFKENEFAIEKKYISKFKTILPSTKVLKIMHYDHQFRQELLERIKKRMEKKN